MLSDYSQYRKIIENQLHRINETYDLPGNPPLQEQSFQQPELGDEVAYCFIILHSFLKKYP